MKTLKDCLVHQLREMKREMLKAIQDLGPEDLTSHEPGDHSPIAWIVEHCCGNLDFFIHKGITGRFALEHEHRFLAWPIIEPRPGDAYRSLKELVDRWSQVCDASAAALGALPEQRLQESGKIANRTEPLVQSCLRVINHQNAHLRQIWCILGRRRIDSKYPDQETWLA